MLSLLTELERLVIPIECPGCGRRDVPWCEPCTTWLRGPLRRVEQQVPRLDEFTGVPVMPVWALGDYVGPARGLVVAWKDKGREDLTKVYQQALAAALKRYRLPQVDVVVPMPSSRASVRHRGRDHLAPTATYLAKCLAAKPRVLLSKSASRDQVGLSARARGQARLTVSPLRWHRAQISGASQLAPGARVLLFDDVVTTGATLAAARRALLERGLNVVGAVVLAATPPRTSQRENIPPKH